MEVEEVPCLKINCPAMFKDEEFVEWLRTHNVATWDAGSGPVGTAISGCDSKDIEDAHRS